MKVGFLADDVPGAFEDKCGDVGEDRHLTFGLGDDFRELEHCILLNARCDRCKASLAKVLDSWWLFTVTTFDSKTARLWEKS